ncbi:MAG: hypothetical protein ACYCWW_07040 [Deltaproteobacteria bacterium]
MRLAPLAFYLSCALAGCSTGGRLWVDWTFDGRSCAAAGVATVELAVTGVPPRLLPCQGSGHREGGAVDGISDGVHTLTLRAFDASGGLRFEAVHEGLYFLKDMTTGVKINVPRAEAGPAASRPANR